MPPIAIPVPDDAPTFASFPRCPDLATLDADVAVLGVPHGVPYDPNAIALPSAAAPSAIRAQSVGFPGEVNHYDFDLGGPLFAGRDVRVVDCGNVETTARDGTGNAARTTAAVRAILERGAVPIVLGGDDSVPIPVLRAYEAAAPFCVVQLDAHLDWRDERYGVPDGYSSTMRRASELPWIAGMAQIGLRGVGSARAGEVEAARTYGSVLVRAAEVHADGVAAALGRIPAAERYYVALDIDALDPSLAPGVGGPAFGGLTYDEVVALLRGVVAKGRIVGFDLVEVQPENDVRDLTSLLAARLALVLIGAMAHAGQIGR